MTKDEIKKEYGGAYVTLLDGDNGSVSSGGTVGGTGTITWSVTWDTAGFTGNGWVVNHHDYSTYTYEQLDADS